MNADGPWNPAALAPNRLAGDGSQSHHPRSVCIRIHLPQRRIEEFQFGHLRFAGLWFSFAHPALWTAVKACGASPLCRWGRLGRFGVGRNRSQSGGARRSPRWDLDGFGGILKFVSLVVAEVFWDERDVRRNAGNEAQISDNQGFNAIQAGFRNVQARGKVVQAGIGKSQARLRVIQGKVGIGWFGIK